MWSLIGSDHFCHHQQQQRQVKLHSSCNKTDINHFVAHVAVWHCESYLIHFQVVQVLAQVTSARYGTGRGRHRHQRGKRANKRASRGSTYRKWPSRKCSPVPRPGGLWWISVAKQKCREHKLARFAVSTLARDTSQLGANSGFKLATPRYFELTELDLLLLLDASDRLELPRQTERAVRRRPLNLVWIF